MYITSFFRNSVSISGHWKCQPRGTLSNHIGRGNSQQAVRYFFVININAEPNTRGAHLQKQHINLQLVINYMMSMFFISTYFHVFINLIQLYDTYVLYFNKFSYFYQFTKPWYSCSLFQHIFNLFLNK